MLVKVFISCVHVVLEFGLIHFVRFSVLGPIFMPWKTVHKSQFVSSYFLRLKRMHSCFLRSQTISSLTKFIQKILSFVSPNMFSMKIYSIINLMILIVLFYINLVKLEIVCLLGKQELQSFWDGGSICVLICMSPDELL